MLTCSCQSTPSEPSFGRAEVKGRLFGKPRILSTPSSLWLASPSFMQHVKVGAMLAMLAMVATLSWGGWMQLWFYPSTSFKISTSAAAKLGTLITKFLVDWFKRGPQNAMASWKNGGRPTVSTVVTMMHHFVLQCLIHHPAANRRQELSDCFFMFSIFKARREDATYLKWTLLGRERGGEWFRSKMANRIREWSQWRKKI